jgi:hypothetical protein
VRVSQAKLCRVTTADIVSSRAAIARQQGSPAGQSTGNPYLPTAPNDIQTTSNEIQDPRAIPVDRELNVSWRFGTLLIVGFFVTFITIMVLRGVIRYRPIRFSLFSNMYLAGAIIFGGGPVVVPLLRQ